MNKGQCKVDGDYRDIAQIDRAKNHVAYVALVPNSDYLAKCSMHCPTIDILVEINRDLV